MNVLLNIIVILLFLVIYVTPSIIALIRRHPQGGPIFVINIFLGFTYIGWVVSLAWATMGFKKN